MYPFASDGDVIYIQKADSIKKGDILLVSNPLDYKRSNPRRSFSRCVACPGDKVQIYHKRLYVNGLLQQNDNRSFDAKILLFSSVDKEAAKNVYHLLPNNDTIVNTTFVLTQKQFNSILTDSIIKNISQSILPNYLYDSNLYPFSRQFNFNKDYYGPITIPAKGLKINLNAANYLFYKHLFNYGEKVKVEYRNGDYYVDGKKSETYTFSHNYYFLLNDYIDNPSDSRTYGPVADDEILARVSSVFFNIK